MSREGYVNFTVAWGKNKTYGFCFETLPRVGEYVTIDGDQYLVKKVVYSETGYPTLTTRK